MTETDKEHVVRNIKTKNFDIHFSWYPFTGDIFYNNKVNIEHRSSQSGAVPINARVYIEAPNFKFTAFTISFSSLHMCTSGTVSLGSAVHNYIYNQLALYESVSVHIVHIL